MTTPSNLFQSLQRQARAAWNDWADRLTVKSQDELHKLGRAPDDSVRPQWILLLLPEIDNPEITTYDSPEALSAYLQTRVNERGLRAFPFYGVRARISEKPYRYLLHPNGTRYPLFTLPTEMKVQEDDLLGPEEEEEQTSTIGQDFEEEAVEDDWNDLAAHDAEIEEEEPAEDEDEDDES